MTFVDCSWISNLPNRLCFLSLFPFKSVSSEERKKILLDIADALEANEKLIRTENESDIAAAQQAGIEKSLISRLTLKPGKVVPPCLSLFHCDMSIQSIWPVLTILFSAEICYVYLPPFLLWYVAFELP